jgi:hypothetical protein
MKMARLTLLALVWLPLFGLLMPCELIKEGPEPWYIDYTTPLFLLSALFYFPAACVAQFFPMHLFRVVHWIASAAWSGLLTIMIWRLIRSRYASA